MTFVYDWITKIVLFMLIGTIIEMLLPSNTMKKYVHFVFGLLFLLLLAQPIFYLFQTDITEQILRIEEHLQTNEGHMEQTKKNIEKQKEDIQAEQAAYIWNELALHYIEEANPTLKTKFNVQITDLSFLEHEAYSEEITFIVSLTSYDDLESMTTIKPIEINTTDYEPSVELEKIEESLRHLWELEDKQLVQLRWEGGRID